jgi:hypothetical protein
VEEERQREDSSEPHDAYNTGATSTKREVNWAWGSLHNLPVPCALANSDTTLRHLWWVPNSQSSGLAPSGLSA